ncbi:hypothetical protein DENSPDRAFT_613348 [Dentipellis sp. KUC8613]|nr:hypothetical protein DENSPDRAFT_613348 [Dentipellis sp. KUC8613]
MARTGRSWAASTRKYASSGVSKPRCVSCGQASTLRPSPVVARDHPDLFRRQHDLPSASPRTPHRRPPRARVGRVALVLLLAVSRLSETLSAERPARRAIVEPAMARVCRRPEIMHAGSDALCTLI